MSESREDMKYEEVRLSTFRGWPANAKVEAWKMAKAGLLYTGQSEEVECTFCGCVLTDWQYGDQVMSKHRQANPSCVFVQNQSDNVPLGSRPSSAPTDGGRNNSDNGGGRHASGSRDVADNGGRVEPPQEEEDMEDTDDVGIDTSRISGGVLDPDNSPGSTPMDLSNVIRQHDEMKSERNRLASFSGWTVPFIRPADLAKAGFYYVNQRDNCRCAFCDNFVGDWEEGDVPQEEHAKLFPLCGFVRGAPVGNIPLEDEGNSVPSSSSGSSAEAAGHDETGIRYVRRPNSIPEKGFPSSKSPREFSESLGIISHHGPLHPSYATPEARLRTFREWPPALKQQPQELADAGFYYIGLSDQVKCFYCDGGLRNWQPEDDPWVEHARWFEKCVFVRLRKGDEFIKSCVESKPPEEEAGGEGPREVTEEDIRAVMSEAIVRQVLSMGIDHSRVKMAIKKQLQAYGSGFDTPEHLINAAFSVQRQQERRENYDTNNPSGALLDRTHRRSYDEVTSRHYEDDQPFSTDEDELPETFASLPANVNLNRSSATPTSPPTSSVPAAVAAPNQPPAAPASTVQATTSASDKTPAEPVAEADLESENARLKEQRTCKVCMDGEVGVVFLPCGHLICCVNCAPSLKDCPVCRSNIQGTVRTFMS